MGILYELEQKRLKAERAEIKTKTKEVKEAIDSGDTELIEALEEVREEALTLVDAGLGDAPIQVDKYCLPAAAILKILWRV